MGNREKLRHFLRLQGKKPLKQSLREQSVQVTSKAKNKLQHLRRVPLVKSQAPERIWLAYSGSLPPLAPLHTHTNTLWLNRLSLMRKKSFHKGEIGMLFLKGSAIFKSAPQITSVYFKETPKFPRQQKPNPQAYLRTKACSSVSFRASLRLNIFLVSWLFIWECCCWQYHLIVGKWLQV